MSIEYYSPDYHPGGVYTLFFSKPPTADPFAFFNKIWTLQQNYIGSATWGRRENIKYEKHETYDFATPECTSIEIHRSRVSSARNSVT